MGDLSLSFLGTFEAVYAERPLTHFRTKAVQALLIYLLCQPEAHSREALMTLLWPELPTKSAQGNLRHTLYHLRQIILTVNSENGDVPFVLADRQTIQVNPDGRFQLDIRQFEKLALSQQAADWDMAVSIYRGDFLSDFSLPGSLAFENWTQGRRADVRRRLLDTLDNLTNHHLDEENFEQAEQFARQQLAVDNLREEAHRQLMLVLARNGRRAAALTHYQTLAQLLHDELSIAPSAATQALVAAIRDDNLKRSASTNAPNMQKEPSRQSPHNLPQQTTLFIGRHTELAALDNLLANPQTRLITIVGAGGMGKTRLSLAAAKSQLKRQNFAQGIFFVPLADLDESDQIATAIAAALQIRLEQGESQLLNYLSNKNILLVLDNFEHLLAGRSLINRLLKAAPLLQILVTSRERLHLNSEQIYPIQGLSFAGDTAVLDDAHSLFLQAARRIRPDFQPTATSLSVLNQICQLVAGMPLALELAAGWIDVLALPEIAAEIRHDSGFLESDIRDIPYRHRSMQTVFETSWQQLSPELQQLLAQISVFRRGFTREAVTAVAGASLHDLVVLVNKSLLTFDRTNGRYTIHTLLRQYIAAKPQVDITMRDRHSVYYCQWVAAQSDKLYGPEQMVAVEQIKAETDNIRTAINHAMRQERFADLDSMLPVLTEYYRVGGQRQEGIRLYRPIYDVLNNQPDKAPFTLFWITQWLSEFYGVLDQTSLFETYQQQVKEMLQTPFFKQRDSRLEQAVWLYQEGYRLLIQEPNAAIKLFRQSHALLKQVGNNTWLIRVLIGLARAARNAQDLDYARATVTQTVLLAQTAGDPISEIEAHLLMSHLDIAAGQFAAAEERLSANINHLQQINQPILLGLGLMYLTQAQEFNGRFAAALQTARELQQMGEKLGNPYFQNAVVEAQILVHLGNYEQSSAIGQAALRTAEVTQKNWVIFIRQRLLGMLALEKGYLNEARSHLQISDSFSPKGQPSAIFNNQIVWALIAALEGETAVAQQISIQLLRDAVEEQHALKLAMTFAVAACLYAVKQQPEQAITLYALARQAPFVANSRWFADVVGKLVVAASAMLPAEKRAAAAAHGKTMDMWETAVLLQTQLQSTL